MPTGDALTVLLTLLTFAVSTLIGAVTVEGRKATSLWIATGVFGFMALAWGLFHSSLAISPATVFQYLLIALPIVIVGVVAVMLAGRRSTPDEKDQERKRQLIDKGRDFAAVYSQGRTSAESFRKYLESTKTYAAIRPYLSKEYLAKLNDSRTVYAKDPGALYEPLVQMFLDELDRLEAKWGLA